MFPRIIHQDWGILSVKRESSPTGGIRRSKRYDMPRPPYELQAKLVQLFKVSVSRSYPKGKIARVEPSLPDSDGGSAGILTTTPDDGEEMKKIVIFVCLYFKGKLCASRQNCRG